VVLQAATVSAPAATVVSRAKFRRLIPFTIRA
jgi:hypothetical protein